MANIFFFFVTTFSFLMCLSMAFSKVGECDSAETSVQDTSITVSVVKNSTDDWITTFYAERNVGSQGKGANLDLKQSLVKCGERHIVRIKGVIRDEMCDEEVGVCKNISELKQNPIKIIAPDEYKEEQKPLDFPKLKFSNKKGRDAVIVNDGLTAYRKDGTSNRGWSGLISNRPLRDNELFELKIEKTLEKLRTSSVIFGVTLNPPTDIDSRDGVYNNNNGTWALWSDQILKLDGTAIKSNYPLKMASLLVGDRIGVMRKSDSNLHFFLNGEDKGVAAKYVPGSLYGFFDLFNFIEQVSIVS